MVGRSGADAVVAVETAVYRIPTRREIGSSTHRYTAMDWVLCRIRTADGLEGVGFTYTWGRGTGAIKALIDQDLSQVVLGQDPADVQAIWERMWRALRAVGAVGIGSLAMSAVDIALWDLLGRRHGLPLYRLLGRHRDRVKAYGSGINLNYTLDELVEEMAAFRAEGFTAFKMKTGLDDLAEDVRRIEAVRAAIGADAELMIDENQRWSVPEALRRGWTFQELNLAWLEEPVIAEDYGGYSELSRKLKIPIAGGEAHHSKYQFKLLLERGAVQVVQPDACRVGGITEWMKIARLAEAWNVPVAPHLAEELHVHLLCAIPNASMLEHLPAANLRDAGVLVDPMRIEGGFAYPPERPGHGVVFDFEALNRYALA